MYNVCIVAVHVQGCMHGGAHSEHAVGAIVYQDMHKCGYMHGVTVKIRWLQPPSPPFCCMYSYVH